MNYTKRLLKLSMLTLAICGTAMATEHVPNSVSTPNNKLATVEFEFKNNKDYDTFCPTIAVTIDKECDNYGEYCGSESQSFNNVFFKEGELKKYKYKSELVIAARNDGHKVNFSFSDIDRGSTECRKATFTDYCEFAKHTDEDIRTIDSILRAHGERFCDGVSTKNKSKLTLRNSKLKSLEPLKYLHNLSSLFLKSNEIVDVTPLKNLKHLEVLELSENEVVDITPLANVRALKELNLSKTNVTSIAPLIKNKYLKILKFNSAKVTELKPLFSMPELKCAEFNYNNVSDYSENKRQLDKLFRACSRYRSRTRE